MARFLVTILCATAAHRAGALSWTGPELSGEQLKEQGLLMVLAS